MIVELLRSYDAIDFASSTKAKKYSYNDSVANNVYYCLKQVDINGRDFFSSS